MLPHIYKNFAAYNEQLAQRKYETDRFKVINDTLAAVIQLCSRFITPLMSIMNHLSLLKSRDPIIYKLDELSQKTVTVRKKEPHFNNAIAVKHLHFSYGQTPVLRDVSLTLLPTKKYAILFLRLIPSGSMKSIARALISGKGPFYKFYSISDPNKAASGK